MLDYIKTLRSMIGNTKIVVPGVRALMFDAHGGILLQKQTLFDSWSLPHGCVDVGESVFDALRREVKEETGLSVLDAQVFGIYSDPKYSVTYPNGDQSRPSRSPSWSTGGRAISSRTGRRPRRSDSSPWTVSRTRSTRSTSTRLRTTDLPTAG